VNNVTDIPDVDTARDGIYMRDQLRHASLKLELREQDVERLAAHNAYLESDLKLQEQRHTNALKDIVMLKRQLAEEGRPELASR
jgi:hypothetical protein